MVLPELSPAASTEPSPAATLDSLLRERSTAWLAAVGAADSRASAAAPGETQRTAGTSGQTNAVVLLDRLRDAEREQLRARSAEARRGADQAELILRLGLLLVLVVAPLAWLIVRNDIRLRQASERALRESEARVRAAADGSLDAFYVLRAVRDGAGGRCWTSSSST